MAVELIYKGHALDGFIRHALGMYDKWYPVLYQVHACFLTFAAHVFGPDAGLCLAYMGLVQKDHAQTALADTSTYAQRQGALQQTAVEVEFLAVSLALEFQLVHERILVHADTHGRHGNGLPDQFKFADAAKVTFDSGTCPEFLISKVKPFALSIAIPSPLSKEELK